MNVYALKFQHVEGWVFFKAGKKWGIPDLQDRWTLRSQSADVQACQWLQWALFSLRSPFLARQLKRSCLCLWFSLLRGRRGELRVQAVGPAELWLD